MDDFLKYNKGMLFWICVIAVIINSNCIDAQNCLKYTNTTCIEFIKTPATFDQAKNSCQNNSADLIMINDDISQKFVSDWLLANNVNTNLKWWIGGKETNRGTFVWADNAPLGTYMNWEFGGPTDQKHRCVHMTAHQFSWEWTDLACSADTLWFICQKDNVNASNCQDVSTVTQSFYTPTTTCYTLHKDKVNWFTAFETCNNNGKLLVTVGSKKITGHLNAMLNSSLAEIAASPIVGIWTGLHSNKWVWTDGQELSHFPWLSTEPSAVDECIAQKYYLFQEGSTRIEHYRWSSEPCTTALNYICEKTISITTICPTEAYTTTSDITTEVVTTTQTDDITTLPDTTTLAATTLPDTTLPDTTIADTTVATTLVETTVLTTTETNDLTTPVDTTTKPDDITTAAETTLLDTTLPITTMADTTIVATTLQQTTMSETTLADTTFRDTTKVHTTTISDITQVSTVDNDITTVPIKTSQVQDTTSKQPSTIETTTISKITTIQSTQQPVVSTRSGRTAQFKDSTTRAPAAETTVSNNSNGNITTTVAVSPTPQALTSTFPIYVIVIIVVCTLLVILLIILCVCCLVRSSKEKELELDNTQLMQTSPRFSEFSHKDEIMANGNVEHVTVTSAPQGLTPREGNPQNTAAGLYVKGKLNTVSGDRWKWTPTPLERTMSGKFKNPITPSLFVAKLDNDGDFIDSEIVYDEETKSKRISVEKTVEHIESRANSVTNLTNVPTRLDNIDTGTGQANFVIEEGQLDPSSQYIVESQLSGKHPPKSEGKDFDPMYDTVLKPANNDNDVGSSYTETILPVANEIESNEPQSSIASGTSKDPLYTTVRPKSKRFTSQVNITQTNFDDQETNFSTDPNAEIRPNIVDDSKFKTSIILK